LGIRKVEALRSELFAQYSVLFAEIFDGTATRSDYSLISVARGCPTFRRKAAQAVLASSREQAALLLTADRDFW
jgi:hypothetical protein